MNPKVVFYQLDTLKLCTYTVSFVSHRLNSTPFPLSKKRRISLRTPCHLSPIGTGSVCPNLDEEMTGEPTRLTNN